MNEEIKKYLVMIAAMSVDCSFGGITFETYLANLKAVIPVMERLEKESQG
jgi:hypothetical protein